MRAGIQHVFVAGIRAQTDVEYQLASAPHRWNELHLAQSQIDSACGLLSFCTAAAILTGIARHRFEKLASATRGPLRHLWLRASSTVFEGTDHRDIESYAQALGLHTETLLSASAKRLGKAADEAIGAGHVSLLRFDTASWSHFATVVGVERVDGSAMPSALLLLDPSDPAPWIAPFNARLELTAKSRASVRARKPYVLPLRYLSGSSWGVKLRCLVIVRARPP